MVQKVKARVPLDQDSRFLVLTDNCTGCILCQLACSYIKTSAFSLSRALIRVDRDLAKGPQERYAIRFSPDCDGCGVCVNYCNYGALQRISRRG